MSIFAHVHTWSMLRHVHLIEIANTQLFTHTWSILRRLLIDVSTCTHVGCYVFFVLTELAKMQRRCYAMCIVVQQ